MLATVSLSCVELAGSKDTAPSKDTGAGRGTVTRNRRTEAAHGSGGKKRWRAVVAHSWWRAAVTRGGDTATRGDDTQRHVAATHSNTRRRQILKKHSL